MQTKPIVPVDTNLPPTGFIDPVINPVIEHWSHFRCGSYTSEWVSRAVGIENAPSNFLLKGPVWFDLFRPITPGDMRKLFKAKGMTTVEMRLNELSTQQKLDWIRREITEFRRPPVILIRTATLHWIAIGGYDDAKRLFYIYDARYGKDSINVNLPIGNATMSYEELLFLWSARFPWRYVAIVVVNVNVRDLRKEKAEHILNAYAQGELVHKVPSVDSKLRSLG